MDACNVSQSTKVINILRMDVKITYELYKNRDDFIKNPKNKFISKRILWPVG